MPFDYVPSGRRYDAPSYQTHREGGQGLFLQSDPWLPRVLQQRHLLQVGFVDLLIGKLLDRLEEQGILDEALIVITADHGTSFRHGLPRRSFTEGTRADVMQVPLILKLPGQVVGQVSDRNVETVDIVPTIASALNTTLPYEIDGRSLFDTSRRERAEKSFVQRNAARVRLEKHEPHLKVSVCQLRGEAAPFSVGTLCSGAARVFGRTSAVIAGHPSRPRSVDAP